MTPTPTAAIDAETEIARCHARLEIDHAFIPDGGEFIRFEIPMAERSQWPDAIECRDATIRILDSRIAELEHIAAHFTKLAKDSPRANTALDTARREWEAKKGEQ